MKTPMDHLRELANRPSVQPDGTPPRTVAGGLGVVRAAAADVNLNDPHPTPPARRPMKPGEAQALMLAELMGAVRALYESCTELSTKLGNRQGATNGVLDVFLTQIPAEAVFTRTYPVTCGSVAIINHSDSGALIVTSGTPSGTTPPTGGRGVQRVEPLSYLVVPIADRSFSVWGTAGGSISVQAFTGLQPWGGGAM